MILFTFPYAGGSSTIFYGMKQYIRNDISIVNIEYPGHGTRIGEELLLRIEDIAEDAYKQLLNYELNRPYSLMGYSMGCVVIHELLHILIKNKAPMPAHVFICASDVPYHEKEFKNYQDMTKEEIIEEIKELKATPDEVINNEELFELFYLIIRSDFIACDQYRGLPLEEKIPCECTIQYSESECKDGNEIFRWFEDFDMKGKTYKFGDGHFFIHSHMPEMCKVINSRIQGERYWYEKVLI